MTNTTIYELSGSLTLSGVVAYTNGYPPPSPTPKFTATAVGSFTENTPVASDRMGQTVAINGSTFVVSAPNANSGAGVLYVYEYSNSAWSYVTTLTAGSYATSNAQLGGSLSINGNYIVAGAANENAQTGSVYVFENISGNWQTTPVARLQSNYPTSGDRFGASVSVAGNLIIVGSPGNSYNGASAGLAFAFTGSGSSWSLETELAPHKGNIFAGAQFGSSVSVYSSYVAVGASQQNSQTGAVFVYNRTSPGVWSSSTTVVPNSPISGSQFGSSVCLQENILLVGAPSVGGGQAYAFTTNYTTWTQSAILNARATGGLISDSTVQSNDMQGISVSYDITSNVALVGSQGNNNGNGAVYVYENVYGTWYPSINSKLTASNGSTNDYFGASVSISNSNIVVGAPQKSVNGNIQSGEIYTFD